MVSLVPLPTQRLNSQTLYTFNVAPPRPVPQFAPLAVPLCRLAPYDTVTNQFEDYGLLVNGGMAIVPSNPKFIDDVAQLSLMPVGNQRQLRLTLQRRFAAIALHLQGYRDFRVDVLDQDGHSLAVALKHHTYANEPPKAPIERIIVDTATARQLMISSNGAFLLNHIQVFPHQETWGETLANQQKLKN